MAKVTIKLYTTLKERLNKSHVEVNANTLKEALEKLCIKEKKIKNILFEKKGKVKGYFVITINSNIIDNSKISKIKLFNGDIINIFPPVSGG
ncbi:MAG: MoaD/ThiS family protein [Elusimicrobiales bacterium]|nr:MoaD/ThiS family protein [Elusimicrobiales bacterium]